MLCLSLDLRGFCAFLCVFGAMASSDGPSHASLRRREILLGGSCSPRPAARSPSGAERLLFQACRRARSTGVRPPPLASTGVIRA